MKIIRIIILLLIIACNNSNHKSDIQILNNTEFASILKAIHLTEAKNILQKPTNIDSLTLSNQYDSIFQAHNIQEEIFHQSMEYYLKHPKELEAIYDSILVDLRNNPSYLR